MHSHSIFSLLPVLYVLAPGSSAERMLPSNLQVDLIFPRDNETYAPTQLFPIVFGISNLDAAWPLNIRLSAQVESLGIPLSMENRPLWATQYADLGFADLAEAFAKDPRRYFFHFSAVNMTNGTTDTYQILWDVVIPRECFAGNSSSVENNVGVAWSDAPSGYGSRYITFSTAPRAQLPDIEATLSLCQTRNGNNSAAVRITKVKSAPSTSDPCPVLDRNVKLEKCIFQSAAKELAANVSAELLGEMRCDKGDWRTITTPCPKENMGLQQSAGISVRWLLQALVFSILAVL
ncbi:hypothetical protein V495_05215 [Pseudogymnoascus sp. VKM F-4514 (FW-929)]|nr:hypothetical protein V495_05215 [Pseudogymnoascus sp. VKM F-4514 (FW-929)]KFY61344.1 hypothetical protein V497_03024 [Pseudogymnoascus sp. VKM F-4516 (FW-969)]